MLIDSEYYLMIQASKWILLSLFSCIPCLLHCLLHPFVILLAIFMDLIGFGL
jgi:hypothetical protein